MANLLDAPFSAFYDDNGNPLNGGKVYTYSAGTTTPQATYTTSAATVQNTNPVILDSAGRAVIWLVGNYKITVTDALDNVIRTVDNITSNTATGNMSTTTYDPAGIAQQMVGINAVQTLTNKTLTSPTITTPLITGITNAGNASAGNIGEVLSSTIASGSAVALTNGVAANITSVSLTAGDWDVDVAAYFTGGATTQVNYLQASISATSATVDISNGSWGIVGGANAAIFNLSNNIISVTAGVQRVNIASTQTYYLVARAAFSVSTCSAYGIIRARRIR